MQNMDLCLKIIIRWKFIARKNFGHEIFAIVYGRYCTAVNGGELYINFVSLAPNHYTPFIHLQHSCSNIAALRTINSIPQARNVVFYL